MFAELLQDISSRLKGAGIPHMIIGGQAVLLHGEPRLTKDIDVTLGIAPDEVERVITVAREADWKILPPDPRAFAEQTFVLPVEDSATQIRIDLIFSFTSYEHDAIARAVIRKMGDVEIPFISAEDLVVHKVFAGRPRDLEDAATVLLKNPGLNLSSVYSALEMMEEANPNRFTMAFDALLESTGHNPKDKS